MPLIFEAMPDRRADFARCLRRHAACQPQAFLNRTAYRRRPRQGCYRSADVMAYVAARRIVDVMVGIFS